MVAYLSTSIQKNDTTRENKRNKRITSFRANIHIYPSLAYSDDKHNDWNKYTTSCRFVMWAHKLSVFYKVDDHCRIRNPCEKSKKKTRFILEKMGGNVIIIKNRLSGEISIFLKEYVWTFAVNVATPQWSMDKYISCGLGNT